MSAKRVAELESVIQDLVLAARPEWYQDEGEETRWRVAVDAAAVALGFDKKHWTISDFDEMPDPMRPGREPEQEKVPRTVAEVLEAADLANADPDKTGAIDWLGQAIHLLAPRPPDTVEVRDPIWSAAYAAYFATGMREWERAGRDGDYDEFMDYLTGTSVSAADEALAHVPRPPTPAEECDHDWVTKDDPILSGHKICSKCDTINPVGPVTTERPTQGDES